MVEASHRPVTLILGGARSGKSSRAETLTMAYPAPWVYIATAQSFDGEMKQRIAHHKARRGEGWRTVEEPLDIAPLIRNEARPCLIDCLTLWLTNVMLAGRDVETEAAALLGAVEAAKGPRLFVSNEVGLGIVPEHPLGRAFRDAQGRLNQQLAAAANTVLFMVAGLPMVLKDE